MPKNRVNDANSRKGPRPFTLGREKILTRLWELANLSAEATKGNIGGQIKAMRMIVAIEDLIPDYRQVIAQKKADAEEARAREAAEKARSIAEHSSFYVAAWRREPQPEAEADLHDFSDARQQPPLR